MGGAWWGLIIRAGTYGAYLVYPVLAEDGNRPCNPEWHLMNCRPGYPRTKGGLHLLVANWRSRQLYTNNEQFIIPIINI